MLLMQTYFSWLLIYCHIMAKHCDIQAIFPFDIIANNIPQKILSQKGKKLYYLAKDVL